MRPAPGEPAGVQIGAVGPGTVQPAPRPGTGPGREPGPQPGHVLLGLRQPLRGEPATGHRLAEGPAHREVGVLRGVAAEAEQVGPGGHGEHGGLGDAVQIAHGPHFQRI